MFVLWTLFLLLVAASLARWVLSGQGDGRELTAGQTAEIARLREETDQLRNELRRLAEEQAFLMRLLAPGTPTAADSLPEARPPTDRPNEETP